MLEFKPEELALDGIGVIEASAGTGKTFSITKLYLRLLLEQAADVEQIMVSTFTEAAAAELSERIYADLFRALQLHGGLPAAGPADDTIVALMDQAREQRGATLDVEKELRLALLSFDRAPIGTIHSFCRRVLADFAFAAGRALSLEELGSGEEELRFAFRRIWHQRLSADDGAWMRLAADRKSGEVFETLRELIPHGRRVEAAIDAVRRRMQQARSELSAWRRAQAPGTDGAGMIDAAIAGRPDGQKRYAERLKKAGLPVEACRLAGELNRLALFHFEAYADLLLATRSALGRDLGQRRLLTFDGIVEQFAEATRVQPDLADAVYRAHPWALVDEFQDTGYDQTEAFLRIWGGRERGGMIMIGDPKQAIYGFRGGDVYAYLKSRDQAGNAATLSRNYRSVPSLLDALNQVFRDTRNPFLIEGLNYQPVRSGRPEEMAGKALRRGGRPVKPLSVWFDPRKCTAADLESACRKAVVAEIGRLLADGRSGDNGKIKPGQCAVLVRTNHQGREMQQALAEAGVPAVCVADQSVFLSEEADEILRVLRAVAEPRDDRLVRAALCTRLLGANLQDVRALAEDEHALDRELRRFEDWSLQWRGYGVLAALYPIIAGAGPRTLSQADGARRMTNWLHIADLLQQSGANRTGRRALLAWLEARIRNPDGSAEAQKLRLETDSDAVQVATVHRSKGLEYDIVFAPFLWSGKGKAKVISWWQQPKSGPLRYHDEHCDVHFDFGGPERNAIARTRYEEDLAEDLRLIYVALTRARLKAYASWGNLPYGAWRTGVQWLFCADGTRNREGKALCRDGGVLKEQLAVALGGPAPAIEIAAVPEIAPRQGELTLGAGELTLAARPVGELAFDDWTITSFSRLAAREPGAPADPLGETDADPVADAAVPGRAEVFADMAGTRFGNFVHAVLEHAEFQALADGDQAVMERQLRRHGLVASARQREALARLFTETVTTRLEDDGPRLVDIPAGQRIAEMEFHLRLAPAAVAELGRLIAASDWGQRVGFRSHDIAHPLPRLHGLLNGFIDLVIEWEGRYHVIDYKSNLLGFRLADYRLRGLGRAMAQHRYHLQYLFYTLAVHRHLHRLQAADYDYERDLAGACYLFVRGMRSELGPRSGIYREKPEGALIEALDALLGGTQ